MNAEHKASAGDVDASYRRIFFIALPIMASNAMLPLVGIVDAAVIGRMGEIAPLAAIGLGNLIVSSMFWLFIFLSVTTTASIGQAISRGERAAAREQIGRAIMISIVMSLLIIALIPLWVRFLPWLFGASEEVRPFLVSYIAIRLIAAPAALLWRVLEGVLIAREKTRIVFAIEALIQFVNLVLDLVFVMGFGWGVGGVAAASVIAQFLGMFAGIFTLKRDLVEVWIDRARIWARRHLMRAMLKNSGYVFLRSLMLQIMIGIFYVASSHLGDDILAINSILQQFIMLTAMSTDGFAVAVEVLVARSIGAGNIGALRRNIMRGFLISLLLALMITLALILFGDAIVALITTNAELRGSVAPYWLWLLIAINIGVFSWTLDGVYFGANLGRESAVAMTFATLVYAATLLAFLPMGNTGLWLAFTASYVLRTLGLLWFYPRVEALAQER